MSADSKVTIDLAFALAREVEEGELAERLLVLKQRIEDLEREKLLWLRTAVNLANDVCCGDQRASGHMLDEYKERVTKALEAQ